MQILVLGMTTRVTWSNAAIQQYRLLCTPPLVSPTKIHGAVP